MRGAAEREALALLGGRIYTADRRGSWASAVAIED